MKYITLIAVLFVSSFAFSKTKPVKVETAQQSIQSQALPFFSTLDTYDQVSGEPIPLIIGNFPKFPNQLLIQNDHGEAVVSCTLVNNVIADCALTSKHTLKEAIQVLLPAYQFTGPGAAKR